MGTIMFSYEIRDTTKGRAAFALCDMRGGELFVVSEDAYHIITEPREKEDQNTVGDNEHCWSWVDGDLRFVVKPRSGTEHPMFMCNEPDTGLANCSFYSSVDDRMMCQIIEPVRAGDELTVFYRGRTNRERAEFGYSLSKEQLRILKQQSQHWDDVLG